VLVTLYLITHSGLGYGRVYNFTKEMEDFVCAAQEQALMTKQLFLLSTKREYKGRHDAVAPLLYWTLLKQAGCHVWSLWWRHTPNTV